MNPRDIADKKFEKSKVFGYKTTEVDSFIAEVLKSYEEIYKEREELEKKVDFLVEKLSEYRDQENKLTDILLEAKKVSDNVIKKAKDKAESIVTEATSESNEIVSQAQKEVQRQKSIFMKLQKETSEFKDKMLSTYRAHIELISELPSYNPSEEAEFISSRSSDKNNFAADKNKKSGSMKERTFSISLDKDGVPVKIDEEGLFDTKSIPLKKDIEKVNSNNESSEDDNTGAKFKEPLKFGSNYNFGNKNKKNKSK